MEGEVDWIDVLGRFLGPAYREIVRWCREGPVEFGVHGGHSLAVQPRFPINLIQLGLHLVTVFLRKPLVEEGLEVIRRKRLEAKVGKVSWHKGFKDFGSPHNPLNFIQQIESFFLLIRFTLFG